MKFTYQILLIANTILILSCCAIVNADISYSGGTYSQNFDGLANSGNNNLWANDSTLQGWSLFQSAGTAITSYNAGNGNSAVGRFYSYGSTGSSERSFGVLGSGASYFGSPATGTLAGHIAVQVTNNTGLTIDSFTLGFDGEQWRNAGNLNAQAMNLEYGFGNTFAGVSTWNAPGGNFNWSSIVNSASAAAVDGNATGKVAGLGGTINSLNWNQGTSLWVRWIETNDIGNDHGMAIDNFAFSATTVAIPEPASGVLVLIGFWALGLRRRRN